MIKDIGRYYIYRHIRLDKNEPFYIGIGTKRNNESTVYVSSYRKALEKKGRGTIWNKIVSKTDYEVEILVESDDYKFLLCKEVMFIKLYGKISDETGTLANLTDGGEGSVGISPSKETIEKGNLSRRKIFESRGYLHTEEGRKKISRYLRDRICKDSTKKLRSELARGRGYKGIEKAIETCKKPVIQLTLGGEEVKTFPSGIEAANETGSSFKLISMVCREKRKKHNGFRWKFVNI